MYRYIKVSEVVGTFYTPFSIFFYILPSLHILFFPLTQLLARSLWTRLCGKDQELRLSYYFILILFSPLLPLIPICDVCIMLLYPIVAILEILLMLCSFLCCFGLCRLYENGWFEYSFKVRLVTAKASASKSYRQGNKQITRTAKLKIQDVASEVEITNYPIRRFLKKRPIAEIFRDMEMDYYTFGDIDGLEVTQSDIERYRTLVQVQNLLQEKAESLV